MSQISSKGSGGGGGGGVNTLTGNIGTATASGNNINVVGGSNISTTGVGDTLTVDVSGTTDHAVQVGSVAGSLSSLALGTSGQVLTSNGAGMDPSFQTISGSGITTIDGDTGSVTGSTVSLTGLTTAGSTVSFSGSGTAMKFNVTDTVLLNTIVGSGAGNGSVSGGETTAFGYFANNSLTSGNFNHSFGHSANGRCQSGNRNNAFGYTALSGNITGSSNCAFGMQSLVQLATTTSTGGSFNCAFGELSGLNYTGNESSNVIIANQGTLGDNNVLRIGAGTGTGNQQLNSAFICGINGITVTGVPVLVSSSDQLGIAVSSERYKYDIEDMNDYSDDIHELRPVTFNYKQELNAEHKSVGLIAEEVEKQMPQLVVKDEEGLPMTVKYNDLIPMLLNEVQKLRKELDALKS